MTCKFNLKTIACNPNKATLVAKIREQIIGNDRVTPAEGDKRKELIASHVLAVNTFT